MPENGSARPCYCQRLYVGAATGGYEPEEHQAGIQFWGGSFICDPRALCWLKQV